MESLPAAAAKKEGRLRNNCIPLYLMWFLIENFNLEITDVVAFTIMSPTVLLSPFSLRWEPGRNGQSGLNDDHSSRHNFVSVVSECVITLWCLSVCDHSVVSECVWSLCCVCGCVITLLCVCVWNVGWEELIGADQPEQSSAWSSQSSTWNHNRNVFNPD